MKKVVEWFIKNSVAANLIAIIIVCTGIATIGFNVLRSEVFPSMALETVLVNIAYPGASPEEIEDSICLKIEEKVSGIEGIDRIVSLSLEGIASIFIEAETGYNINKLLDEVQMKVNSIDDFPLDAEKPIIEQMPILGQGTSLAVSGNTSIKSLRKYAEKVQNDLLSLGGITQVELVGVKNYEISIEITENDLKKYGLRFGQISRILKQNSINLPGGSLKTNKGEILLRVDGKSYSKEDFGKIPIIKKDNGSSLLLADIANISDGFKEEERMSFYNGKPSVLIQIFRIGNQDVLDMDEKINKYLEESKNQFPEEIKISKWNAEAELLQGRLKLLLKNAAFGFLFVFIILALFLRISLAFWVSIGIPISFLGTVAMMPYFDVTVNMISLFAFILVLGIVVDDAIVVGESIFYRFRTGKHSAIESSVIGTKEVVVPVIFAVLTTAVAFAPMLMIPGMNGNIWKIIPLIIIPTLFFSLIESLFILPVHLSILKTTRVSDNFWTRFQKKFSLGLENFVEKKYFPFCHFFLLHRYFFTISFVCLLVIGISLFAHKWMKFSYMPPVEPDFIITHVTMPKGVSNAHTLRALEQLENASVKLNKEWQDKYNSDENLIKHTIISLGEFTYRDPFSPKGIGSGESHLGEMFLQLVPSKKRKVSTEYLSKRLRELTGPIPGAVEVKIMDKLTHFGMPIDVQFIGSSTVKLRNVAEDLKNKLLEYPGVVDIADSFREGKQELQLQLKPSAKIYSLELGEVAKQIRQSFYGEEIQKLQRGREELKVMLRYPLKERNDFNALERMQIQTPAGREVPLSNIASWKLSRSYSSITRVDQNKTVRVTANVRSKVANAQEIRVKLKTEVIPDLLKHYPDIKFSLEGEQKEQDESIIGLLNGGVVALLIMYTLMAIPFRSYAQPFIIMSVIPFGILGAQMGHLIMGGQPFSILSILGIVALTGVVVNDSIVLIAAMNRFREEKTGDKDKNIFEIIFESTKQACKRRFRPIILTSLTTFGGLIPMLLETDMQAKFLIPMAISLSFGVLFATTITLILVPCLYLILEDIKSKLYSFVAIFRS